MLDVIEQAELAAEKWADENIEGDKFRCGCGEWCLLDEGVAASAKPYARPICPQCAREAFSTPEQRHDDRMKLYMERYIKLYQDQVHGYRRQVRKDVRLARYVGETLWFAIGILVGMGLMYLILVDEIF